MVNDKEKYAEKETVKHRRVNPQNRSFESFCSEYGSNSGSVVSRASAAKRGKSTGDLALSPIDDP